MTRYWVAFFIAPVVITCSIFYAGESHSRFVVAASTVTLAAGPGATYASTPTPEPVPTVSIPPGYRDYAFFPTPPPGVTTYTATGILEVYGYGMHQGGFIIKRSSGSSMFFVAPYTVAINGVSVDCKQAPDPGQSPNANCMNWPSNLVVGKTNVTVTYWRTSFPNGGAAVAASNKITY